MCVREAGMQRRKLVATAGALSVTAFAATLAIGANIGLVGQAEPRSPVGRLDDHHQVAVVSVAGASAGTDSAVAVTTPALGPGADD
jgi:hypothetical protein